MPVEQISLHNHYCVTCHDKKVDYCRSGFHKKKADPKAGCREDRYEQQTRLSINQKISEMHWLKQKVFTCCIDSSDDR